jgi:hypothetical protein
MTDLPARRHLSQVAPLEHPNSLSDNPPGAVQPTRRNVLDWFALAAGTLGVSGMLAACGNGSRVETQKPPQKPMPGSLIALAGDVLQLSILNAQSQLPSGRTRFAFGLSDKNNRLVEGLSPQVWLAKDQTSRAVGPFPAHWLKLAGYEKTKDRSPRSDVTGYYLAEVDVPEPGKWQALALVEAGGERAAAHGAIPVRDRVVAQVGTKPPALPTPVATSLSDLARVCTREPVCPMHYISLDQALKSGKPTVLGVGTPLLCEARMCGPVLDEQLLAFRKFGSKANFIHYEIYPQRDESKPAPLYTAFGFQNEPWTLVIDRTGVIRATLGDGPAAAAEIEAALQPLLA